MRFGSDSHEFISGVPLGKYKGKWVYANVTKFESNDAIEEMRNLFGEGEIKRYIFEEILSALNRTFGAYVEDFSRIRVVINAIKHRLLKQIERQEYGKRMSINELLFGGE